MIATALLFLTGGPTSLAQFEGPFGIFRTPDYGRAPQQAPPPRYGRDRAGQPVPPGSRVDPRYAPPPSYGSRYTPPPDPRYDPPQYGGRAYQPSPYGRYAPQPEPRLGRQQQAPSGGFYWPWERRPEAQPQAPAYSRRDRREAPREAAEAVRRRAPRPAPVVAAAPVVKPKKDPSTVVAVFGDSLAELVGDGLEDAFGENPDVVLVAKTRADSGLVRTDVQDWPKVIQDTLNSNPKASIAVVMLGSNDRQSIREGDTSHEPLSDRWRELYRERIDAVLKALAERRVQVVWVGAPPMRNERLSADILSMNDLFRDRVQRAGGVYVDIWPGFVNDENRYSPTGPDVAGQVARLRTNDGVHFTRAGARKAAHFADVEIKRLLELKGAGTAVASLPGGDEGGKAPAPADVDKLISASLPALPEPPGLPAIGSTKPLEGRVMPLTRADVSPGGALVTGRPRIDGDAAYVIERAFRDGVAPAPRPGRADDYKWPRS